MSTCDVMFGGSAGGCNGINDDIVRSVQRGAQSQQVRFGHRCIDGHRVIAPRIKRNDTSKRDFQLAYVIIGDATADYCMGAGCDIQSINQSNQKFVAITSTSSTWCVLRAACAQGTAAGLPQRRSPRREVQNENIAAFFLVPNMYTSA
jgi:hypothetical protein